MFSQSVKKEIYKIVEHIKNYCIWESSKNIISPEDLFYSKEELEDHQTKVNEFGYLYNEFDFFFNRTEDINNTIKTIQLKNSYIDELDITEIYRFFKNMFKFRKYVRKSDKIIFLKRYLEFVPFNVIESFENRFSNLFDSEGKFDENRVPEIKRLNRMISSLRAEILKKINSYMNRNPEKFSDTFHTFADGRYVLPYKKINKKDSIVHFLSDSGNTFFAEPLWLVDSNNDLREMLLKIEKEKKRIFNEISVYFNEFSEDLKQMYLLFCELDVLFAKALYKNATKSFYPRIDNSIKIRAFKNPLISEEQVVPVDIMFPHGKDLFLISGPNAGGKTVLLKSLFFAIILTQMGIPVKCEENCSIKLFDNIYDIFGDESSILNSLSTFSGHIAKLSTALKNVTENSIIFIDEIASGTDPEEGGALAISIIEALLEKGSKICISTHLNFIKNHFFDKDYSQMVSMRFDLKNSAPSFLPVYGTVNSSYAMEIANINGISDKIIERANSLMSEETRTNQKFINSLEKEREKYDDLNNRLSNLSEYLKEREREIEAKEKIIEVTGNKKIEKHLKKLQSEFDNYRREALEKLDNIKSKRDVADVFKGSNKIERKIKEINDNRKYEKININKLNKGDIVFIKYLKKDGTFLKKDKKGVKVEIDNIPVTISEEQIFKSYKKKKVNKKINHQILNISAPSSYEIKLIGMPLEDAIYEMKKFLDNCYSRNISPLRIVHGNGIIKNKCLKIFKKDKRIKDFSPADYYSGGAGVSVIHFKK